MFDASLATHIGGPYGLSAFLTAMALAAGARLADAIVPVREILPRRLKQFRLAIYGLCGLGVAAYLGLPGATLVTDTLIVPGSAAVATYLFLCGRRGMRAAQVIAPSAAAFALVALAAAVTSLGGLGETLTAPATTGGFAAAGAVLLALAVIASEEIAVLPFLHGSHAARLSGSAQQARRRAGSGGTRCQSCAGGDRCCASRHLRSGFPRPASHAVAGCGADGRPVAPQGDPVPFRLDGASSSRRPRNLSRRAGDVPRPAGPGLPAGIPGQGPWRPLALAGAARQHRHRTGRAVRLPGPSQRRHRSQGDAAPRREIRSPALAGGRR